MVASPTSLLDFSLTPSISQTPVSSVGGGDVVTTGAFFSKPQKQEDFRGSHDLVSGNISTSEMGVVIGLGIAAVGLALYLRSTR